MGVTILLPLNIGIYDPKYQETRKFDLKYRMLLLIILLIPIALSLYSVNCLVNGKCVMWSYVNTVAICLSVILFLVSVFVASEII